MKIILLVSEFYILMTLDLSLSLSLSLSQILDWMVFGIKQLLLMAEIDSCKK